MSVQEDSTRFTVPEILSNIKDQMGETVEAMRRELSSLRIGRASPVLVENITVDYYGVPTPLNQLASISTPEARLIIIQPWDKNSLQSIEKSLMRSDLGFNPSNDGNILLVPIPPLSQERRQEMVRLLKRRVEDGKVSVRNIRRGGLENLRSLERNKTASQDDVRKAQEQLQRITDGHIGQIDQLSSAKEAEILQV